MESGKKKTIQRRWWKESAVYQIYPASFKDGNGDGLGDIPGIISELDYIKNLGVDVVWLSPCLQSPQVDMGYDISDYRQIHAPYGTMADHDALIQGLHDRGLKYVLDLVVNHTSDQHEWFKQSRSSKNNPYRDWYIWRPARYENGNRIPPNNWESAFSGSVWEWDDETQEYYLHIFAKEQPDLNWENPKVVAAVHDIIRFWLDRGVDGFRMDVINLISKAPGLPDGKITKPGFLQSGFEHFACGPRLHEYLRGIGKILEEYDGFSVGEMPGVNDPQEILKAVGQDRGELGMAFHFEIVGIDSQLEAKWDPRPFSVRELKVIVDKWQSFMLDHQGWNALYMENHDQSRTVSRYCSDGPEYRTKSAKLIAAHLALQSGTVFVYQGQELAQKNIPADWPIEKYKDIECLNHWQTVLRDYPNDKEKQQMYLDEYRRKGRDNARTPMQWTDGKWAGFMPPGTASTVEPWMDIHPDYPEWNAKVAVKDQDSAYHYWAALLELRKEYKDIFIYGDFEMLDFDHETVVAYVRTASSNASGTRKEKQVAMVVTNFSQGEVWWRIPDRYAGLLTETNIIERLRNYPEKNEWKDEAGGQRWILLRPYEAMVAIE